MGFTNSPLVTYTNITKNRTPNRNHAIDTITIHCIVGQWTAKDTCDYFATTERQCSSNYVVGKDGSISLSVEEKDRSWCSSNAENDHRAVTIEVASDTEEPYAVTDKAYNALIQLVADICKRNDIKELKWKADKNLVGQVDKQNMTVHRWFSATACPGTYLYERYGEIASKVNKILGVGETVSDAVSFADLNVGDIVNFKGGKHFTSANGTKGSDVGASKAKVTEKHKENSKHPVHLRSVDDNGNFVPGVYGWVNLSTIEKKIAVKKEIKVGSTVRLKKGAKTFQGGNLASFVYERNHQVKEINVDRVVITYNGVVVAAVRKSDLTVV